MKKLHEDGLPIRIVEIIEDGEKLTVSQIAKRLKTGSRNVQRALCNLRKKGYTYNSVGSRSGADGRGGFFSEEGVIVDVTENEDDFKETQNNYEKQIMGRTNSELRMIEIAFEKQPGLRSEITSSVNNLLVKFLGMSEDIKKLEKSNKKNGDKRNTSK